MFEATFMIDRLRTMLQVGVERPIKTSTVCSIQISCIMTDGIEIQEGEDLWSCNLHTITRPNTAGGGTRFTTLGSVTVLTQEFEELYSKELPPVYNSGKADSMSTDELCAVLRSVNVFDGGRLESMTGMTPNALVSRALEEIL